MARTFETIIAPTDFSDSSRAALEYALDMASPGGRVVVCHVVDDVPLTYGYVGVVLSSAELRSRMAKDAEKELEAFLPDAPEGVTVETRILHGSPYLEVVRLAAGEGADLVVMGTHGRSGLQHVLLGSVAEKVVRKSPCPVLVVRPAGSESPGE